MSDKSTIEWTEATWNPVTGCTKVSPGCDHCYAERIVNRFKGKGAFDTVALNEAKLIMPFTWRGPRMVFVNSMSDLFHDDIPAEYIAKVFAGMALNARHTFQVLTKRHGRMRALLASPDFQDLVFRWAQELPERLRLQKWEIPWGQWPLPNVWLGVSVEDQKWANVRIPALLDTPAAVRWLSCEPLLGPVDLTNVAPGTVYINAGFNALAAAPGHLDWIVVGGESGPGARPMHPDWARSLRDQCQQAKVPFFFKQWGEWAPNGFRGIGATEFMSGGRERQIGEPIDEAGHRLIVERVGKKKAGRELDGRTWDEYPAGVR